MSRRKSHALGKALPAQRLSTVDGAVHLRLVGATEQGETSTLRRAAEGDTAATREIYRAHVDRVYRHVVRILGPNDGDVEDVVQKVFMVAFDSASAFEGRSKLSTWLVGIATRRALDEARARSRRGRWARLGEFFGATTEVQSSPDARLSAGSEAERYLQLLTLEQRTVFVLKEVEGYTFQEISEMTRVRISTLHARLKSARKRLDAALAEEANHA